MAVSSFLVLAEEVCTTQRLDRMAGRILQQGDVLSLVEKAQAAVDEDEAKRLARKAVSKRGLDLQDFLGAMRQMQSVHCSPNQGMGRKARREFRRALWLKQTRLGERVGSHAIRGDDRGASQTRPQARATRSDKQHAR